MADSEADSDATVAHEPMSDGEGDADTAGEKSPSFLNTQAVVLDGSSGEREGDCGRPMSPELPLAAGTQSVVTLRAESSSGVSTEGGSTGDSSQLVVEGSEEEETAATSPDLDQVVRLQTDLLQSLQETHPISLEELKRLQTKLTEVESFLREISAANQTERKRLASAHSSLSQSSQTPAGGGESLRRQLMGLAARQKTLLLCFKTQKEVAEKLDKLVGRVDGSEPGRDGDSRQMRRPPGAIPNLLQHLRPQAVQTDLNQPATTPQPGTQLPRWATIVPTMGTHSHPPPTSTVTHTGQRRAAVESQTVQETVAGNKSSQQSATTVSVQPTQRPQPTQSESLAVPVALQTLVQHGFLQPGDSCLSCTLMGCEFSCSLLEDGSLSITASGARFKTPNQWLQHCWARLGQHRSNLRARHTFRIVMYRGAPLMDVCEKFNRKQVSSFHQMKKVEREKRPSWTHERPVDVAMSCLPGEEVPPQPPSQPRTTWSLRQLLTSGQVLLLEDGSLATSSLQLPASFWESGAPLTPQLVAQLERDLKRW